MTSLHYRNNPHCPPIKTGDLAYYKTVRAGTLKVKVIGPAETTHPLWHNEGLLRVVVTSRSNPFFHPGEYLTVSPLWLDPRQRATNEGVSDQ